MRRVTIDSDALLHVELQSYWVCALGSAVGGLNEFSHPAQKVGCILLCRVTDSNIPPACSLSFEIATPDESLNHPASAPAGSISCARDFSDGRRKAVFRDVFLDKLKRFKLASRHILHFSGAFTPFYSNLDSNAITLQLAQEENDADSTRFGRNRQGYTLTGRATLSAILRP